MTAAAEIQRYNPSFGGRAPAPVSQATAIEQQRAIAEVQAAVVVAQSCPRNMGEAEREMEYVCGRLTMAERAFYQVTNRGTGASVHLMRELARIWGNVDYGVKELHRNDEAGESEVQAFAWDIQKNTRSSRTFIVPHQRMVKIDGVPQRKDLVDLTDIYLNNQNVGARAVRECIDTILPRWFVEKAQDICHNTLKNGEGKPLQERIAAMINRFAEIGVTEKQLEARLEKKRGQWTPEDLAQLTIAGQSISRGEARRDDLFPPLADESSTADEIAPAAAKKPAETASAAGPGGENEQSQGAEPSSGATVLADSADQQPAPTPEPQKAPAKKAPAKNATRKAAEKRLFALLGDVGLTADEKRDDRLAVYQSVLERDDITSTDDLTNDDVKAVSDKLYGWSQDNKLADEVAEIVNAAAIERAQAADGLGEFHPDTTTNPDQPEQGTLQ